LIDGLVTLLLNQFLVVDDQDLEVLYVVSGGRPVPRLQDLQEIQHFFTGLVNS
jgi:hypothetical protein